MSTVSIVVPIVFAFITYGAFWLGHWFGSHPRRDAQRGE